MPLNRLAVLCCGLSLLACAGPAAGQIYVNPTPITIVDNHAAAMYPSQIVVSGFSGPVGDVQVRLSGVTHTNPADLVIALQAPNGQVVVLTSRCGGSTDASNASMTFRATLSNPVSVFQSGVFRPTTCSSTNLPAPCPAGPYSTDLTDFVGTDPNGPWNLWVGDFRVGDVGTIAAGWYISLIPASTSSSYSASSFTYQGIATEQGVPINGPATMRFRLFDALTGGNHLGPTVVTSLTLNQGLFSTPLDFGIDTLDPATDRYLELMINGVVQSPRQRLTTTPRAATALNATTATSATTVPWAGITGVPANVSGAFSPWTTTGSGIGYTGTVAVGTTTPSAQLSVAATSNITSYQTSSSPLGTWMTMHNETATNYWQFIATGTGNGGGANDLVITNGPAISSTVGATIRLHAATNFVGIGLSSNALPSQRLTVNGNVLANNVAVPSSIRFKDHVEPMDDALSKLLQLEGVRFDWKPEWAKERPGREHDIGFVAEDVEKIFPEVVFRDADGNVTGMDYSRLTAVAIEAIKQQQKKFDAELARRDAENAQLKARLDRLEKALNH